MSTVQISPSRITNALKCHGGDVPAEQRIAAVLSGADDDLRLDILSVLTRIEQGIEAIEKITWLQTLFLPTPEMKDGPSRESGDFDSLQLGKEVHSTTGNGDLHVAGQVASKGGAGADALQPWRSKHHIYGRTAALTIELDHLRKQRGETQGARSVLVEAALAGAGGYDWMRKIPFQLMKRELPIVACGLLGMLDSPVHIQNHGPEKDKSLWIEDQGDKLYVKVSQRSISMALPVEHADAHAWATLVLEALHLNSPVLGYQMQQQLLQRVAAMVNRRGRK